MYRVTHAARTVVKQTVNSCKLMSDNDKCCQRCPPYTQAGVELNYSYTPGHSIHWHWRRQLWGTEAHINQSINFYLLKMSRDKLTHKRLFNCEQDNEAETSTNSCPTNKLYYERKGKTQRVQNSLRWRAHTLYQFYLKLITVTKIRWIEYNSICPIDFQHFGLSLELYYTPNYESNPLYQTSSRFCVAPQLLKLVHSYF